MASISISSSWLPVSLCPPGDTQFQQGAGFGVGMSHSSEGRHQVLLSEKQGSLTLYPCPAGPLNRNVKGVAQGHQLMLCSLTCSRGGGGGASGPRTLASSPLPSLHLHTHRLSGQEEPGGNRTQISGGPGQVSHRAISPRPGPGLGRGGLRAELP